MGMQSLRRKALLVSTMLAGAYAGYGNRAYAQQVCTHQSGTTYLCDGATILEQTFFGENIIVVTGDNLEVDTTAPGSFGGNAFSLGDSIFGISGAVSFIDIDGATLTAGQDYAALSIFGGGDYNYYGTLYPGSITVYTNGTLLGGHTGLYAYNNGGTGSVDITVNGSVTGTGYYGIRARNANAGGDLIITTGAGSSVSGGYSGILAENNGQGALAITANGDVTGASYVGISAQNHGTDLTVTTGTGTTVAGGEVGIAAVNSGSGQLTVTAGGDVTGTAYYGIVAQNQGTGLSVTTHAGSSVVGGFSGIEARNFGSGALDITADGDVTGLNGYGIRAQNNGTILTVTAGTGISVSGDLFGIHAQNYGTDLIVATGTGSTVTGNGGAGIVALNHGSGLLAVTAGGDVAGAVYYGILAQNQGADLSVTTEAGSSVVGDFNGIEARNFGSGMLTVSADGDVTGLSGYGIRARGYGTGLVVTTGAESAISGDTTGIYASNTGSGAVTIDAQGDVEATNASGTGIHAANFTGVDADGNSINITTGGTIEGTGLGIYAVNHASGAVNIISTGDVLNSSSGILAYNTSLNGTGTSISIEAARVTTQLSAIYALNNGTGALSIVTTGDITSMNGRGIVAFQAGSDVDIVTLAGTTVSGGMRGISSINGGTGALTIMAGGGVYGTGNNSRGIFAWNTVASTTDLTVTTAAGTTISSVMGGISALNSGSGAVTINAQGDVHATHAYSTGIEAFNNNGVDADGNSINLNAAGTVTGGWAGIYAHNYGPGAVNIVSTGDVSSDVGAGIFAYNVAGTDLNITAAQTTGYRAGIDAIQAGTARLTILATGNVSALAAYGPSIGIWARSDSSGSGIDITTAANTAVNAGATGISARNNGAGALTVTAGGDVTGTGNTGIYTRNQGTDLIVTTGAGVAVSGGDFGIASINDGTGELTVTADGDLTGSNFYGIFAQNSGTDLTITLGMGAAVTGGYDAIEARNFGSGALTITTDGNITGLSRSGIFARSFGSGISIAAALGANITGATHGIRAQNSGAGVIEIDVAAGSSVTSTGSGYAIDISGSEAIVSVAGALNGGAGGAIRFDDFDNQLTLHTGATINGDVVGGALDDSLSLVGVGTGTFNIGQLQNFEILAKDGTGHWILTGANTDAMSFALNAGRLTVDAALGFTDIAVSGGAILGGTGAIGGDVTVLDGGIIAPGASTGTLTVGNLFLSSGSVLDFELGMAGVVGGGVNDLIIVGNDLVLDGVLNITDVGGFGPGVYALITYGGDLTDNGLEFGILPGGVTANELLIQTAVTGEINLLSTFGATLGFWDGADPALHDNGVIDGGQGVWNTVNRNWTGMDGDVNGSWDGGFAVFQGVAGTVTVEGGVDFAGLQIRTDGYVIESGAGGVLNMTGAETILRVDAGVTGEVSAAIAGEGTLVKTDLGTLILTGGNIYTGGTEVRSGTLIGSTSSIIGDIANDGVVVFSQADDATLDQALSGDGLFRFTGGAQFTLAGANTYSGGTDVIGSGLVLTASTSAGTGGIALSNASLTYTDGISVANVLTLSGSNSLSVASGSATHAGSLAGSGDFTLGGPGTLVFAGNGSAFTGHTTITGNVLVNGVLGGTIEVADGGVLRGFGTLGSTTLLSGSTIAPGNSVGTLTIDGDLIFESGSVYEATALPDGSSDLIDVSGTITINGGSVLVVGTDSGFAANTSYNLLTAAGGISGEFDSISTNFAFLNPILSLTGNGLLLTLQRNDVDFVHYAQTNNQGSAARAADSLGSGNPLWDALVLLDEASAPGAFEGLSGEIHATHRQLLLDETVHTRRAINSRLAAAGSEEAGSAWISGHFGGAQMDARTGVSGVSADSSGAIFGIDMPVHESARIGVMASFTEASFHLAGPGQGAGTTQSRSLGLYGGLQLGALGVSGGAIYGWHDLTTRRAVTFPGFNEHIASSHSADTIQLFGEASLAGPAGFEPFLSLAHMRLDTGNFTETGGAAALVIDSETRQMTQGTLGSRLSHDWQAAGTHLRFAGSLGWRRVFSGHRQFVSGDLSGAPVFFEGNGIDRDAAAIEAGIHIEPVNRISLEIGYAGEIGSNARNHGAQFRAKWGF